MSLFSETIEGSSSFIYVYISLKDLLILSKRKLLLPIAAILQLTATRWLHLLALHYYAVVCNYEINEPRISTSWT